MIADKSRTRIALWFVVLSTLAYIIPTILSGFFFYFTLTAALDQELRTLASSIGHAIDLTSGQPHFREWARVVHTDPSRSLYAIELFDVREQLIESYGIAGIRHLSAKTKEVNETGQNARILVVDLEFAGKVVGYLQLEVSTKERDAATRSFVLTMLTIAPVVIVGLGLCSYYVSDKATVPIRKAMIGLRTFLADAGHELNTPLSVVQACAETLQRKLDKRGLSLTEPGIITSAADRMQMIIDDLSILAEIDTLDKEHRSVDITEIVNQQVTEFSIRFEEKGLQLMHKSVSVCTVLGNEEALHVLVSNLLENALRYTDIGGTVEIDVQKDATVAKISVSDTGIGIPESAQLHIFERFYRVDKSRSRASGGSGLGLAIAKAITEAHRGSIEVYSEEGQGSKFTVTLPLDSAVVERPKAKRLV